MEVGSTVGSGVGVAVGSRVGVAVGIGADVGVELSLHAESRTAAVKHDSPNHTVRWAAFDKLNGKLNTSHNATSP